MAAGPGAIVYEQFGSLHLFHLATQAEHPVNVTIRGDLPELRPGLVNIAADEVRNIGISPTGVRVVAEAHGEIFTLPVKKGDTRNISFAKIYNGQNWTPTLTAPLTLPGINIGVGEYLFEVNERELHASDNLDSSFDGAAGKQTVLHVGYKPMRATRAM